MIVAEHTVTDITDLDPRAPEPPAIDTELATRLLDDHWDLRGAVRALPSYLDRNFRLDEPDGAQWVFKVANDDEGAEILDLQHAALERLAEREPGLAPRLRPSRDGAGIRDVEGHDGRTHAARAVSFLPGRLWSQCADLGTSTWRSLGNLLARVDRAIGDLDHPARTRTLRWDLASAAWTIGHAARIADPTRRALVERAQLRFLADVQRRLSDLPRAVIHQDANDHNVLMSADTEPTAIGIFDFGDMVESARVFELAVAAAYAIMDAPAPLDVLGALAQGYDELQPLEDEELAALFAATGMRLVLSVLISAGDAETQPDNDYVRISEAPAWRALEALDRIAPADAHHAVRSWCGRAPSPRSPVTPDLEARRGRVLGPSLSLSYRTPLHIARGRGTYLFDPAGRPFLDCVNNVCHVGHCHPDVVAAAQRQIATLNTNTRYLHPSLVEYAERLTSLLPAPLEVCYFVNSGSEANELALRLARTFTGRHDMLAVQWAYHGHSGALIDLSSYKHARSGGRGAPDWVHVVPCPDVYRARREDDPHAGRDFASSVRDACEKHEFAAFIAEPLIGCGGQIVPPGGWLPEAFAHARATGAVCIADEVQVGFGRVGSHWWAFEALGAIPDIVTLGKPIGNGHPMAAVVTTREIADAFANGMEFFCTFGGNPVSAEVGLAVLDVLEREHLRENAQVVGDLLLDGFRKLATRHECIGDVRGLGLYIGVEFVRDRDTRDPETQRLADVVERCRDAGVLLSRDGPHDNVLKIKPPLCFSADDAALLLSVFERCLER